VLIAPGVINTMTAETLRAFADHGRVRPPFFDDAAPARAVLDRAAAPGVDLDRVTAELEREGVARFGDSYAEILACIRSRLARVRSPA
jgi:transaldolase